jgi:hypothetical protein
LLQLQKKFKSNKIWNFFSLKLLKEKLPKKISWFEENMFAHFCAACHP